MPAACSARPIGRSRTVPARDWQAIFDVNVTGAFYCSQAVAPGMKSARFGRIIEHLQRRGPADQLDRHPGLRSCQGGADRPYPPARPGAGRLEHHRQQCGAGLRTLQPHHGAAVGVLWARKASRSSWIRISLKRLGSADDIAVAVLFFASDLAGWITGQILSVDGGRSENAVARRLSARTASASWASSSSSPASPASAPTRPMPRAWRGLGLGRRADAQGRARECQDQSDRRPFDRDQHLDRRSRVPRRSWSTATTTCSRPIRWSNGRARPSSRRCATAGSMPAASPTTRGRC